MALSEFLHKANTIRKFFVSIDKEPYAAVLQTRLLRREEADLAVWKFRTTGNLNGLEKTIDQQIASMVEPLQGKGSLKLLNRIFSIPINVRYGCN